MALFNAYCDQVAETFEREITARAGQTKVKELPIILDIEASGFGPGSYPIEVGVALADGRPLVRLIKPMGHWTHWQERAEQIHGISRQRLFEEGENPREIAVELNGLLNSRTVYTDGWGVDLSWLSLLFHEANVVQGFRLESIYALLREDQLDQWSEHRARVLEITGMEPHRAGTDVLIVQATFSYAMDPEGFEKEARQSSRLERGGRLLTALSRAGERHLMRPCGGPASGGREGAAGDAAKLAFGRFDFRSSARGR